MKVEWEVHEFIPLEEGKGCGYLDKVDGEWRFCQFDEADHPGGTAPVVERVSGTSSSPVSAVPLLLSGLRVLFLERDWIREGEFKRQLGEVTRLPQFEIDTAVSVSRAVREFESGKRWDWLITSGQLSGGEDLSKLEEYWRSPKAQREKRFPSKVILNSWPGTVWGRKLAVRWSQIFGSEVLVLCAPWSYRLPELMGLKKEGRS